MVIAIASNSEVRLGWLVVEFFRRKAISYDDVCPSRDKSAAFQSPT